MRWTFWRPRSRRQCVVGLDIGPELCSVVVLSGTIAQPDTVCCAERLNVPDHMVVKGEVLQSQSLGQWLRQFLDDGDYQADVMVIGLDDACVSNHLVTLPEGLLHDDLVFQMQAEVQAMLPAHASDICLDYAVDTEAAPVGQIRYLVQAVSRDRLQALQRVAQAARVKALAVEPRGDAAHRISAGHALNHFPAVSAALALQCDEAFGLAMRAWHHVGINFLPHHSEAQNLLRRAWLLGVAVCAMGGAFLGVGFALVVSSAAQMRHPSADEILMSAKALDEATKAHAQAQALQKRQAEQVRWLKSKRQLQSQSLQWSQVLSQAAQGVWVAEVQQQGAHWSVQGEALSSGHAQQLMQRLRGLDIWAKAPELPQLKVMPTTSTTGLPVWQFRIEADLKVGV